MININGITLDKETVKKILQEKKAILLDVRTYEEYEEKHLKDSLHIPMNELVERADELDSKKTYIVFCAHGVRSKSGTYILKDLGFENIYNSQEGIETW